MAYEQTLTDAGAQSLATAQANEVGVDISTIIIGDGGGTEPTFTPSDTALVNEVYSGPSGALYVDPNDDKSVIVESTIPASSGGWTVREVGLKLADGTVLSLGPYPSTSKPLPGSLHATTLVIRVTFSLDQQGPIDVTVDASTVLASLQYVDDAEQRLRNIGRYGARVSRADKTGPIFDVDVGNGHLINPSADFSITTVDGVFVNPTWDFDISTYTAGTNHYMVIDSFGAVSIVPASSPYWQQSVTGTIFGGFHHPGGGVTTDEFFDCCWDVGWRPMCPDPRSMVYANGIWWDAFWRDDPPTDWENRGGVSSAGVTIDETGFPKFAPATGAAFGKRLPTVGELFSLIGSPGDIPAATNPTTTATGNGFGGVHQVESFLMLLDFQSYDSGSSSFEWSGFDLSSGALAQQGSSDFAVRYVSDHFSDSR